MNRLPVAFIDPFVRMCVHSNMWMMLFFCRNMGGSLNHYYNFWHFQFDWIWFPVAIIVRHSHSCCLEKKEPKRNRSKCQRFVKYNEPNRFSLRAVVFLFFTLNFFDFDLCEIQHHRESFSPTFLSLSFPYACVTNCRASICSNKPTNQWQKYCLLFSV